MHIPAVLFLLPLCFFKITAPCNAERDYQKKNGAYCLDGVH
jgi:hypothetical protein